MYQRRGVHYLTAAHRLARRANFERSCLTRVPKRKSGHPKFTSGSRVMIGSSLRLFRQLGSWVALHVVVTSDRHGPSRRVIRGRLCCARRSDRRRIDRSVERALVLIVGSVPIHLATRERVTSRRCNLRRIRQSPVKRAGIAERIIAQAGPCGNERGMDVTNALIERTNPAHAGSVA